MKRLGLFSLLMCAAGLMFAQAPALTAVVENPLPVQKQQKAAGNWKIQFQTTVTPAFYMPTGMVSDGQYLYTGSAGKAMLYKVGFDHKLIDSTAISGLSKSSSAQAYVTGCAFDGTYIYLVNGNAAIYRLNAARNAVEQTISLSGASPYAVTYAPDADNGNGGFYVTSPNDNIIKLFSRSGSLLKTIPVATHGYSGQLWGLAYDTLSAGGPYLYALNRYPQDIIRIDPKTGKANASIHTVGNDVTSWANYYAYGIYIQPKMVEGKDVLGVFFMSRYHIGYDLSTVNILPDEGVHAESTNMKKFQKVNDPMTVTALFTSAGKHALTSYVFNYAVDGKVYSDTVSGKNYYDFLSGFTLTHSKTFIPTEADKKYTMQIWLSGLNGSSRNSDTLDYPFETYANGTQRNVLHEAYSSATCSPCKAGNANLKNILDANQNWVCIKYQQSWPGSGDPYYTDEAYTRRAYYGISSVPYLAVEGGQVYKGNTSSYTAALLKSAADKLAFVELDGDLDYDGNKKFTAEVSVNPLKDISGDIRLFAALVETKTVKNIADEYLKQYGMATFAYNFDTVFHYVMKKFMTPVAGTPVTLKQDSTLKINLEYEFKGNYRLPNNAQDPINHATEHSVEDFHNVILVCWLQDYSTKEVYQAAKLRNPLSVAESNSSLAKVLAYPNPATDQLNIRSDVGFTSVRLVNMAGQTVRQVAADGMEYTLNVNGLAAGLYILQLQTANGVVNTKVQVR